MYGEFEIAVSTWPPTGLKRIFGVRFMGGLSGKTAGSVEERVCEMEECQFQSCNSSPLPQQSMLG